MKKSAILFVILILLACVSCKNSDGNTSSADYASVPNSDVATIQSETQESNTNSSAGENDITSQSNSEAESTLQKTTLKEHEALAIASDLIGHYQTYENVGIACDFYYDYVIPHTDYDEMWSMLSEDQKDYLSGSAYRCKCCKTYEQAIQHLHRCIDSSSINNISKDYVVYKGNLYFFAGAKGSISFDNIEFKRYENNGFVVYADLYGSGGDYCETYAFHIRKESTGYILKRIEA